MACYSKMDRPSAVNVGERIRDRLPEIGISQAELARRVGMSQSAMNNLIAGRSQSSKLLHAIAIELKTTTHYLTGSTDDPSADTASIREMPIRDRQVLEALSALKDSERSVLVDAMLALAESRSRAPKLPTLPDELTLTAMFRGILDHVDASLSKDEQAQLLAELLPIALPATVGARPDLAYRTPEEDQDTASKHAAVSTR